MPTYEYACKACGEHLEVVQSFRDEPLSTCPNCGGELRKVFGAIGIAFKGSGFYKNDSRDSGSGKAKPKSEGKEKEKAEPAASKKGDTAAKGSGSGSGKESSGSGSGGSGSGSGKGESPKAAASS